jgi:hypothetical protein
LFELKGAIWSLWIRWHLGSLGVRKGSGLVRRRRKMMMMMDFSLFLIRM